MMYRLATNRLHLGTTRALLRATVRHFQISNPSNAASVFAMPAMSPTMTEGGIVAWKVKPGEKFSEGDVLLEVETDKATIDVEAQDEGVLWEILEQDGASGIPVGKTIAYMAEEGDDLATLEKPEDKRASSEVQKDNSKTLPAKGNSGPPTKEEPKVENKPSKQATTESTKSSSSGIFTKADSTQKLFPSVELLLHENNISVDDAFSKIPATGPKGRILKGDVLAYLGRISSSSVESVAKYIALKEHLDLSNIQIAPSKPAVKSKEDSVVAKESPNVLTFTAVYELEPELTDATFVHEYEQAVKHAKQLVYAVRYPQYAYSPSPSILAENLDVFEDILSAPVTKNRFEVSGLKFDFVASKSAPGLTDHGLFDEIIGNTAAKPTLSALTEGVRHTTVLFNIKLDESLPDAPGFVSDFQKNMSLVLPSVRATVV